MRHRHTTQASELLHISITKKVSRQRALAISIPSLLNMHDMHDTLTSTRILHGISVIYNKQFRCLMDECKTILALVYDVNVKKTKRVRKDESAISTNRSEHAIDEDVICPVNVGDMTVGEYLDNMNSMEYPTAIEVPRNADPSRNEESIDLTTTCNTIRIRRTDKPHIPALTDAFIIKVVLDKLAGLQADIQEYPPEHEIPRNDNSIEYGHEMIDSIGLSDFSEDNSVLECERDVFVFEEITAGKSRKEQASMFYGLLVSIERGNIIAEQKEWHGDILCRKTFIM